MVVINVYMLMIIKKFGVNFLWLFMYWDLIIIYFRDEEIEL